MKAKPTTVIHRSVMRKGDVYIGPGSKWESPFAVGPDGTHQEVAAKFRAWITGQPHLIPALEVLRGKRLVCHCHPLPCHGDVLAELADKAVPA